MGPNFQPHFTSLQPRKCTVFLSIFLIRWDCFPTCNSPPNWSKKLKEVCTFSRVHRCAFREFRLIGFIALPHSPEKLDLSGLFFQFLKFVPSITPLQMVIETPIWNVPFVTLTFQPHRYSLLLPLPLIGENPVIFNSHNHQFLWKLVRKRVMLFCLMFYASLSMKTRLLQSISLQRMKE